MDDVSVIPNRAAFFDAATVGPFNGSLEPSQAAGISTLLDCWGRKPELQDPRWLAYMLATMAFETGFTMQPVEEPGKGSGYAYGIPDVDTGQCYYGRGYVPLRWAWNYNNWSRSMGKDFLRNPELALQPDIAAIILVEGLKHGLLTGIALGDCISDAVDDPLRARQCVAVVPDHAEEIAEMHVSFLEAIQRVKA